MKEVKSPSKARPIKLPPQKSATDTSNWEKRNVAAPTISRITHKRTVRELEFMGNRIDQSMLLTPQQEQKMKKNRTKKAPK